MPRFCQALRIAALSLFIGAFPTKGDAEAPARQAELYVSARHGDDSWSGRFAEPNNTGTDGPLASFEGARRAVRAIDKTNLSKITVFFRNEREAVQTAGLDAAAGVTPTAVAYLPISTLTNSLATPATFTAPRRDRDGVYRISDAVVLGPEDSGSEMTEIAYQNFPGEFPVFSGGVRVFNWRNVGGNRWQAQLPPEIRKFENLFYNGVRRLRPRLGGYLGPYRRIWMQVTDPNGDPLVCPPGDGYECFDRFDYNANNDPQYLTDLHPETWGNLVPAQGNQCNQMAGAKSLQGEIEILVFEQFSTSKLRVSCVDLQKNRLFMTGPTAVPGANNASEAGFITGNRFVVENVKSALTQPGQWFLDVSNTPMTLTYLSQNGEDPNRDEVIIPQASQLLVAHDVDHLTLRGLLFEHDNYVVPNNGHASIELEPDITSAISFQNARYITVQGIGVRHTSGGGLDFISCLQPSTPTLNASPDWCRNYSLNAVTAYNTVTDSFFYDLGVHGIRIGENNSTALDAVTNDNNVPQFFLVQNNVVSGYGRLIPAAFGIGQGVGHDNTYAYNDVYDGYHCAISISHGGGDNATSAGNANNTIAFNHVHDLLQGIMNDGGSIRIESGNAAFTAPGNRIFNNKIHDTSDASALDTADIVIPNKNNTHVRPGYGGDGIYLDNSTGLVDVENNLVYRVSGNAVYTPHGPQNSAPEAPWRHGQSNLIKNNILAFERKGVISVNDPYYTQKAAPFTAHPVFLFTSNLVYFDRDDTLAYPFYVQTDCTFSGTLSFPQFQAFERNVYWRADGAFGAYGNAFHIQQNGVGSSPCSKQSTDWTFYYFNNPPTNFLSWQADAHEDASSIVRDPGFVDPKFPADNYRLRNGSPNAFFVPFDTQLPGRQPPLSLLAPPPVEPTFVTAPFDPRKDF